jgi:hypothetical protein
VITYYTIFDPIGKREKRKEKKKIDDVDIKKKNIILSTNRRMRKSFPLFHFPELVTIRCNTHRNKNKNIIHIKLINIDK